MRYGLAFVFGFALACHAPADGGADLFSALPSDLDADAAPTPDLLAAPDLPPPTELPDDTVPCEHLAEWPYTLPSASHPLVVHYRAPDEAAMAATVLGIVDYAWSVEVDLLGFRPPLPDSGACGDDDRFDVFVWRGHEECYVDVIGDNAATPYADQKSFLVVDPWGPYGGVQLDATVAHEFNHACQASDDWEDATAIYEMTAVLMEEAVYPDNNEYQSIVADFQSHPDWSIDRDDDYQTWFMYGATLYLMYVRDRFYDGGYEFASALWFGLRSPPDDNEPDFVDALDTLLAQKGSSFIESLLEFARWRYYTGANADGAHLKEADKLPAVAMNGPYRIDVAHTIDLDPAPMLLGTGYVVLAREDGDPTSVSIKLAGDASVRWVVQAVPGLTAGSDGETLTFTDGKATVSFGAGKRRVLVVSALPRSQDGPYDPDDRTDDTYAATLTITP